MDTYAASRENRREAVLASLAFAPASDVERRFRVHMGAAGAWNEWDQRFADFIVAHANERLLTGTTGGGFFFAFSPRDTAGFWVLEARDGGHGKGFLTEHDAGRILVLARLKGLPT